MCEEACLIAHKSRGSRYTPGDLETYDKKHAKQERTAEGHEAVWLRRPFFMCAGGSLPAMQVVDTPGDVDITPTRRRTRRPRSTTIEQIETEAVTQPQPART